MKLKNSNCDENFKTQIVKKLINKNVITQSKTKLQNSSCDKTKNSNCDKNQTLKL